MLSVGKKISSKFCSVKTVSTLKDAWIWRIVVLPYKIIFHLLKQRACQMVAAVKNCVYVMRKTIPRNL